MSVDARTEEFERVELFGKPALFSPSRIYRSTVSKNLYHYELCDSDNKPGKPVAMKRIVGLNHTGTVITAEAVDFKGKEHRPLRGRINFLEHRSSQMDFLTELGIEYIPQMKYEPRAAAESDGALFFSGSAEDDARLGCVGHLRFYYDHNGKTFAHTWFDHETELKTDTFRRELQEVVDDLRVNGPLENVREMMIFCCDHYDARLTDQYRDQSYGFTLESKNYSYYLRCSPRAADYSYLYCYDKETLQMSMAEQNETPAQGVQQMGGMTL